MQNICKKETGGKLNQLGHKSTWVRMKLLPHTCQAGRKSSDYDHLTNPCGN